MVIQMNRNEPSLVEERLFNSWMGKDGTTTTTIKRNRKAKMKPVATFVICVYALLGTWYLLDARCLLLGYLVLGTRWILVSTWVYFSPKNFRNVILRYHLFTKHFMCFGGTRNTSQDGITHSIQWWCWLYHYNFILYIFCQRGKVYKAILFGLWADVCACWCAIFLH